MKENFQFISMPSKIDFQKFRFPDVPDNRKKVDFQLIGKANSQHVENPNDINVNRKEDSLISESVCDLRKSLAWDSAFFNSPGVLDPEELFETINFQVVGKKADKPQHKEPIFESSEPTRTSGISSLRKSLAWDSAFFTSAGVLDAEELSVVNRGYKRPEMALVPGVEDEMWRSAESNSTVTSDGYSLASLEIDLFDDIRAPIHNKSRDASSNGPNSICKLKTRQNCHVSGRLDASPQVKHSASSGVSKSSSSRKPPKISNRANPSPTLPSKRASLSATHAKMDDKASKYDDGKNMGMSKKMCLRESCNMVSSSRPSVKSPSSALPAITDEFARYCYASADFTGKSPSNFLRRTDSRLAASGSSFRTPLKLSAGKKNELVNSSDSVQLLSTPKSYFYTSLDGWSSESPLTSIKQRLNSSAASPLNSPLKEIFARDTFKPSYSQRYEIPETMFMNQLNNDDTSLSSIPATADVQGKLKPSGLRMPSPKIGYFDAEDSTGLAQNEVVNFHSGGQRTCSTRGSGASKDNLSGIRTRNEKHLLGGTSTGLVRKSGMKDDGKISIREKKKALKEHRMIRMQRPGEHNKENVVSFENQVDDLSQRLRTIGFSRDLLAGSKGN